MTAIPPSGGPPGSSGPIQQPSGSPSTSGDDKYARYLQSPFAKMFEKLGAHPTGKQMKEIIDNILKEVMKQAQKQEAKVKQALKKLGRLERGEDD